MLQEGWRWCRKCQGMVYALSGDYGPCPAGEKHDPTHSGNYFLEMDNPQAPGQHGWRWCSQCQGLCFGQGGVCPGATFRHRAHDTSASSDYAVPHRVGGDPQVDGHQQGWRWCSWCQGLYFGSGGAVCPTGGNHSTQVSGHYAVRHVEQGLITTRPFPRLPQ